VFHILPIAQQQYAEKAIYLAIDAVKWHGIRGGGFNPRVEKEFNDAYNKFMGEGMKIINKTRISPSIKYFNKKVKRSYNILERMEARRKKYSGFFI
ncbi:MAG: hypothetical protein ACP5LN_10340, partial [Thermoproteota archaeon]